MSRNPLLCWLFGLLVVSGAAFAKTIPVGPDKPLKTLAAAIAGAAAGDRLLIDAGEYFDCAVITLHDIIIEGAGKDGSTVFTDKTCAGKALLITAGDNITVRNLTLTRARVPDGNGAGIRAEGANLNVERVKFINNQNGILAGTNTASTIIVKDSVFSRNGACSGACSHGIYAGGIKRLHVENSTFSETKQGHHIKSRAARTEVIGCTITDGLDGTASYLIEIPNGGGVLVKNNTLEKGPKSENHTGAIVIGMEGVTQPTREIRVEDNIFRNTGRYPTFLVVNQTATEALVKSNTLSGTAKPLRGDGAVQ